MTGKTSYLLLPIFIVCFLLSITDVYASEPGQDDDWKSDDGSGSGDQAEQAQDAISNQGSGTFSVPTNTQVDLPGGGTATVGGSVVVNQGQISHADSLSFNQADFQSVDGFSRSGDNFFADFVNLLTLGSTSIHNARGVSYENSLLSAEHADGAFTESYISVSHAESIQSGDIKVTDAENTEFVISDFFIEARPENSTKLNIVDSSGNELEFSAAGNNSKVIISAAEPSIIIIRNGLLKHIYGNITEAIIAQNTATIRMGDSGFQCMEIEPIATFWHNENFLKDFGINIPAESFKYELCLRKFLNEQFNDTDGLVDYVDKNIMLGGIANYLRYPIWKGKINEYMMSFVYQGKDNDTKAYMQLDNNMMTIPELYIDISEQQDKVQAITHTGYHQIVESGKRHDDIQDDPHADIIEYYHTSNIDLPVFIKTNLAGVENSLLQPNGQQGSSVRVYPPTETTQDKLKEDLQVYYKERNMENEIKIAS